MTYLTKAMGDRHEADVSQWLGGRRTRGSGNQFNNPADGRLSRYCKRFAFAWDCKSTRAGSISISRGTWKKLVEQAGGERPLLPLRFYDTDSLRSGLDLVVISMDDLRELIDAAEPPPATGGPNETARERSQVTPPANQEQTLDALP